ncbi:MAG: hypothetical protein ABIC36_03085 [bacterium]
MKKFICPQCKVGERVISFKMIRGLNLVFFCSKCMKDFEVESSNGYLRPKILFLKEKYPYHEQNNNY